jgi:hypothetical protein
MSSSLNSSAIAVSDWDNEYARVARHASFLRSNHSTATDSDKRALIHSIERLQRSLLTLVALAPSDRQRRTRLLNHLQQQPLLSSTTITTSNNATQNSSNALLQQDAMLDDLASGVERLKHQSLLIGDEAKLHLNLLQDMESHVDVAQSALEGETRRADALRDNGIAIWKLQLIVAGLSVLLILLILTGLT